MFRYWGSKAEIVWAEVVENMRMSTEDSALWMERFAVLDSTPELRSEESAHWISWAGTVAAYVATRHGLPESAVVPQSIGGAVQAAFLAVLRQWLDVADPSAELLLPELDAALRPLCSLLQHWLDEPDRYS